MASAALKGPGVVLGDIKKLNAASLPKLWHWESEAHGLLNPMDGSTSHCQAPQSIPALGLFVFDDFQTIYVIDLKQQKAQLRKAIPVKSYLYGWTHAEGKLFVVDGAMLSSYELADGDVTLAAHLDLQDGLGNSKILYASLRRAKQRVAWDVFQKLLALNLLFLGFSEVKGGSEQDSQELGIPNEWLTKPRVSFLKADDMTSEEADSKEPLAMPRPPLAGPPKRVPRETLEGDLSTSFLLALIEALQVLGIVYRQELDAPTLCAYLQDNPLELRLFEKYHAESQGTLTLTQQELAQLRSSIPAFSVPVLKKNAEGSGDNLFVLRSDGTILGCNSSLRQAQAEKGFAPATVTKYRGTGTQALVEAGLVFVDETQTFFYTSSDKGLCSMSLQGKAPQSFLPSTQSTHPGKPDSLDSPRIQHVVAPDGSGDQVWACLLAVCGFSAGALGGNSPLAAPLFEPLESGWDTVFDVDAVDELVLTTSDGGRAVLYQAKRPSTVPPSPLIPLLSINAASGSKKGFAVLAPSDPSATQATQAAANIKFPAVLLMEAGNPYADGVLQTALTIVEDCNFYQNPHVPISGPDSRALAPLVLPMGWFEGAALCAPVLHASNRGARQVVVQSLSEAAQSPSKSESSYQDLRAFFPAPGSNLAALSPWNKAVGAKTLEQLQSEGPPLDLIPYLTFKSALSCFALHLPSKAS